MINNQVFAWDNYDDNPNGCAPLTGIAAQKNAAYEKVSNGVFNGNVMESMFTNIDESLVPESAPVVGENPMELVEGKGFVTAE